MKNLYFSTALLCAFFSSVLTITNAQGHVDSDQSDGRSSDSSIVLSGAQLSLIENVRLSARDAGIVESIEVQEGQQVGSGDVVAKLDQRLYAAERDVADRELEIAQLETKNVVDLRYAQVSAKVNEKILNRSLNAIQQFSKSVSTTELEKLELELTRAELSGEQAEQKLVINSLTEQLKAAQLSIADTKLKYRKLTSPIDGIVVEVLRQPGEWINSGEPIARIVNLNRLRVKCLGDAKTISHLKLSDTAVFKTVVNGESMSVSAKLVFISPEIDPVEQDFAIWADVENKDQQLRPGMVGQLEVER